MILIRNCLHGSDITTYISKDFSGEEYIYKSSYTKFGIENLKKEIEGWCWYESRLKDEKIISSKICTMDYCTNGYMRIKIKYLAGYKGKYTNRFEKNFEIIRMFIEQYIKFWPYFEDGTSFMHGDMSIDNIIIIGKDIFVIDWEHFSKTHIPWGFDVLYLIFESLFFSVRNNNLPSRSEIKMVVKLIKLLNKNNQLPDEFIANPLSSIIEIIEKNIFLWGKQLVDFRDKLPILLMGKTQVNNIDLLIKNNLTQ